MSSSKKIACEGTLRQVFIRVYRLEIQLVIFFSMVHPPPLPCVKAQSTVFVDSVWLGGSGGVESCWRPYSAGV
jgi:hypothetical protein